MARFRRPKAGRGDDEIGQPPIEPSESITAACAPISTPWPAWIRRHVAEPPRPPRGLLDTSVVIDLDEIDPGRLPLEVAISAVTLAELAAGPHATNDPEERGRRQDRLQRTEAAFDPLPFDGDAARAYGRVFASVAAAGQKARGARAVDLLVAAVAVSAGLPLYTRNPKDFRAVDRLVEVRAV